MTGGNSIQMSTPNNILLSIAPFSPEKGGNTLADQAFEALKQGIDSGELRPNQRLVELEIAKKLGVSRTPTREALKRLELAGYATTASGGGLIVAELSTVEQIQNQFEIREALETAAIKLACQRATEKQINKAEEYYKRGMEAILNRDMEQYVELHRKFHEALYAACGNKQLLSLVRLFRYLYFDRRLTRVYTPRDWGTQIKHHSRILEALRERNASRAEKALVRHLRVSLRVALQRL